LSKNDILTEARSLTKREGASLVKRNIEQLVNKFTTDLKRDDVGRVQSIFALEKPGSWFVKKRHSHGTSLLREKNRAVCQKK